VVDVEVKSFKSLDKATETFRKILEKRKPKIDHEATQLMEALYAEADAALGDVSDAPVLFA
jgi:hypothetical protein